MNDNYDIVYVLKKKVINNMIMYTVVDLVTGRYDNDSQKFIGSNSKIYDYILFAKNEGFCLRNFFNKNFIHINYLFDEKVYFYFELDDNVFKLIMCVNDNRIVCDDMDLANFNIEYQKMCNKMVKKKKRV